MDPQTLENRLQAAYEAGVRDGRAEAQAESRHRLRRGPRPSNVIELPRNRRVGCGV